MRDSVSLVSGSSQGKSSICENLLVTLKHTDMFGEGFQMRLQGNDSAYRSYMGACCSVLIFIFLAVFSIAKF